MQDIELAKRTRPGERGISSSTVASGPSRGAVARAGGGDPGRGRDRGRSNTAGSGAHRTGRPHRPWSAVERPYRDRGHTLSTGPPRQGHSPRPDRARETGHGCHFSGGGAATGVRPSRHRRRRRPASGVRPSAIPASTHRCRGTQGVGGTGRLRRTGSDVHTSGAVGEGGCHRAHCHRRTGSGTGPGRGRSPHPVPCNRRATSRSTCRRCRFIWS